MSKALKIKDKNENCELIFKGISKDIEELTYRNSAIVLSGEEEFILTPLYDSNSYSLKFSFLLVKFGKPVSIAKKDNLEIRIYPTIDGMSIKEVYENIDSIDFSKKSGIFFIIFINGNPTYYIKDVRIASTDWIDMQLLVKENSIQIFFNGFITKYIFDFETSEKTSIVWPHSLTKESFTFCSELIGLVNKISLSSFTGDIIELLESDYIDYEYTDYYQVRQCSSTCLSAAPVTFAELGNQLVYKPRRFSLTGEKLCTFEDTKIDPVSNKVCDYCSKTSLLKINEDYPEREDFGTDVIQSTHYKVQFSLNENALSKAAVLDRETCELFFTTFELTRPVTRVVNYIEFLKLEGDFSSKTLSLYGKDNTINWTTRMTAWKDIIDGGATITVGDEVFSDSSTQWEIVHNMDTYNIICLCYGNERELLFPESQYPVDANRYRIEWGNSSVGGFALAAKAISVTVWDQLQANPFTIVHGLHSNSEPDITQMQNIDDGRKREEPVEFIEERNRLLVTLLETYKDRSSILINRSDVLFYFPEPQTTWEVEHNLDVLGVHAQIYNEEFETIHPKELYLRDKNHIRVTFDNPQSGYIGVKRIGNPFWKNEIIDKIIQIDSDGNFLGKFKIGDLTGKDWDREYGKYFYGENSKKSMQSENPMTVSISGFSETRESYIFEFTISKEQLPEDININEIGLFDKDDQLCFYSCGDSIYYPREFSFRHKFVIYKNEVIR